MTLNEILTKRVAFSYNGKLRAGMVTEIREHCGTFLLDFTADANDGKRTRDGGESETKNGIKQFTLAKCENIRII